MIKYADIISESMVDGTGIRVTAFLQGCPRSCEGCHNFSLQSEEGGREIEEEEFARILMDRITPVHKGITFSGGDPLAQDEALFKVISYIKQKRPDLDIWVYTGFVFEDIKNLPLLNLIDVLIDGPFVMEKRDLSLAFRGSSNQRIIDVGESLKKGEVVELDF